MKQRIPYTYTILRYVHDVTTGEFVNIGIVLYSPHARYLRAKLRNTYGRLSEFFVGVSGKHFHSMINYVQHQIARESQSTNDLFSKDYESAEDFAKAVLPQDDSSLQWSSVGSGITDNLDKTLDQLFETLVTKYDHKKERVRRDDMDVWKSFSGALEKRNLVDKLQEIEIRSNVDSMTFKHAWKNGVWHCFEPLSFDLVDGESIRHKAHRTAGQMLSLQKPSDPFKLYLLIGEPTHVEVKRYYDNAMKILTAIPVEKEIYTEDDVDRFSTSVEKEMRVHIAKMR